jgi:6-phosphogluconolactonase
MFARLAELDLPWDDVHLFQVDERAVRLDDPDRNWGSLRLLTSLVPLTHQHAMPVDDPAADTEYARELESVLGSPPVLDVVHLGLGDDGHTASLAPGDPILEVGAADVGWVESFRGHRRLSLTIPVLSRARAQVWLICGTEKADIAAEVVDDRSLAPASRVLRRDAASLFLDATAARRLSAG